MEHGDDAYKEAMKIVALGCLALQSRNIGLNVLFTTHFTPKNMIIFSLCHSIFGAVTEPKIKVAAGGVIKKHLESITIFDKEEHQGLESRPDLV